MSTKEKVVSLLIRVARTFGAAFAAYLTLNVANATNAATWKGVVVSALAAGYTAVLRLWDYSKLPSPPAG